MAPQVNRLTWMLLSFIFPLLLVAFRRAAVFCCFGDSTFFNHLYIENIEAPRSVVALGVTHRFCSKYVTVMLYKSVQRR
uniref:SNF1-related protein kinase regulatory subunit beta-3-like n=1 Tax=Nicotiana sylvestris TaxID=4096 RepID=A0A1U7XZ15_NICSY|nr:PREDICTED: SNF1-related protein kinase regulatory subunit beta-3-like [Nicotiana sylvestris]